MNRTYACNRDFLRQLRLRNGWTQSDLAKRAGYSERLISKAEAGSPIALETIVDLADAFSEEEEQQIYWEDLACDPVALAQRFIHAVYTYQKDTVSHIRDFLAEDCVFRVAGNPEEIPFAGEHVGIDATDRMFQIFFSILEVPKGHDHTKHFQYFCQGPNAIIWGDSWIHPIGRPMETPIRVSHLLMFKRGKLMLLDDCYDTAAGAAILRDSSAPKPE
ncbi:helix-turn-helix transcriptional regulator [Bremerella sp. JC817]|uniref:helix-turn-helix transcriptional regulator n=1 Tax=Bremerella sp. JC817 TaxID=3231756 RepID=UPI003457C88D